ncbi:hypothetical protein [Serratia liquefaciens]|uniref:hypothetical protein n=1 Tax=Serratia liquefaciens TaxID=614 RepID=UPI0039C5BF92
MKERPVIFNGEMVRAILDGRKTQTRRVMKVQPSVHFHPMNISFELDYSARWYTPVVVDKDGYLQPAKSQAFGVAGEDEGYACPFGAVGDRLWVRETFATLGNEDGCAIDWNENLVKGAGPEAARIYRASCEQKSGNYGLWSIPDIADWKPHTWNVQYEGTWVPSIHMPRWASRILLEITAVRVERLNDISQADAIAEGGPPSHPSIDAVSRDYGFPDFSRSWLAQTWQHIYGEESWSANPWVWVIEFKRVEVRDASK